MTRTLTYAFAAILAAPILIATAATSLADGAYPFISEQAIVKIGKVRGIPYVIDASYPQFDGA